MLVPVDRTAEFALLLRARLSHSKPQVEGITEQLFYTPEKHATHDSEESNNETTNELSKRIISMTDVIARSRRRYMDFASPRAMKDSERDDLDRTLGEFLQAAMAHIDMLKTTTSSSDAHQLGRILILSERLQVIATESEALRSARISQAMKGGDGNGRRRVKIEISMPPLSMTRNGANGGGGDDDGDMDIGGMDVQQFAEENAVLVADLVETRERVREAEKNVIEIANLNHIFAAKVLEQAREIENLYELAVDSNHYLDYGNRELLAMKGKRNRLQYGLAAIMFILSIFLLTLDFTLHR